MSVIDAIQPRSYPAPSALLQLLKPITWFPPMWAFVCGAVSSGVDLMVHWDLMLVGILLAGPLVCGMSQAANDWCDRHVDAINEPHRPIPSGRMPGRWGLYVAFAMSMLALLIGWYLGLWGFVATCVAVVCAWAYSAEPVRLKRSGLWGPGLVGLCYEGLPWFTGAAVLSQMLPGGAVILIAALYAIGAHGIMTLNDFKALKGDRETGIRSLPVALGPDRAARLACVIMAVPQLMVVALLWVWGTPIHSALVALVLLGQILAMRVLIKDPADKAPWYNGVGVTLYVSGMMVAAFALSEMSRSSVNAALGAGVG